MGLPVDDDVMKDYGNAEETVESDNTTVVNPVEPTKVEEAVAVETEEK